ncbi:MAG: DUF6049 family protein [Candidatus Nanopelagicales bacterium]|nr:DUF6049 family protein [Candidatus Nanopelagicales bacterium]
MRLTVVGRMTAAVAVCLGAIAAAAPAQAQTQVQVVLDAMTPIIPTPTSTLHVTGRVVNTSNSTMTDPHVQLRLSSGPVAGRTGIDAVLAGAGPSTAPVELLALGGDLAPGAQQQFDFSLPMRRLGLSSAGTYALSISALEGTSRTAGDVRTFLPWYPSAERLPNAVGVVWLWPVADAPARTATNVLLDDQTPRALSAGGRLSDLVDVGREFTSTLTWMIDPSLLQSADVVSHGYQVIQDGAVVVGNSSPDAADWLNELRASVTSSNASTFAYADVDATADRRNGLRADVVRAMTVAQPITSALLKSDVPGGVYWSPNGRLDLRTANLLASAGARMVILSTDAMAGDAQQPRQGLADYATSFGDLDAVLADARLSATLAQPQRTASEVLLTRQRFLAETAAIAESPQARARTPLTVVAAPQDVRWAPNPTLLRSLLRATQSAPWMIPTTLAALLNSTPGSSTRLPFQPTDATEVAASHLTRVKSVQRRVGQLTAVQQDPGPTNQAYSEALLRAQSAAWRAQPGTGAALVTAISRELTAQIGLVRPTSSGTITFSGDSGAVPVTLANDSDALVNVGLQLTGVPSSRLESAPITGIAIEPGQKISVQVPVRIVGGDPLTTRVQILTPSGLDYGAAATITLVSTAYARAAGWVVIAAFIAIALFVVVGIGRRILHHRDSP